MSFADEMVKKMIQTNSNTNPVSIYIGKITSIDPVEVFLEVGFKLTSEFLITFKGFESEEGAKVALIRVQGKANIFIILGVIEDAITGQQS